MCGSKPKLHRSTTARVGPREGTTHWLLRLVLFSLVTAPLVVLIFWV